MGHTMCSSFEMAVANAIRLGQLTGQKRRVRSIRSIRSPGGSSWLYYIASRPQSAVLDWTVNLGRNTF